MNNRGVGLTAGSSVGFKYLDVGEIFNRAMEGLLVTKRVILVRDGSIVAVVSDWGESVKLIGTQFDCGMITISKPMHEKDVSVEVLNRAWASFLTELHRAISAA